MNKEAEGHNDMSPNMTLVIKSVISPKDSLQPERTAKIRTIIDQLHAQLAADVYEETTHRHSHRNLLTLNSIYHSRAEGRNISKTPLGDHSSKSYNFKSVG